MNRSWQNFFRAEDFISDSNYRDAVTTRIANVHVEIANAILREELERAQKVIGMPNGNWNGLRVGATHTARIVDIREIKDAP